MHVCVCSCEEVNQLTFSVDVIIEEVGIFNNSDVDWELTREGSCVIVEVDWIFVLIQGIFKEY